MRVAIIGAGPAGLFLGAALAGRGHDVVAVDRDPGPPPDGRWRRPGVMQFHHAHAFRTQVGRALKQEWPEALAAWLALGAEPITIDLPDVGIVPAGHRSRRDTFERALRTTATTVRGLELRQGHVDGVLYEEDRVRGIVVDGSPVPADLVVDASGRAGRTLDELRTPSMLGGSCGMAYVDREYRLREGAEPGPMTNALAWQGDFDGWQALLFLHERGYFSVVLIRPTADAALKDLRHTVAFEAACRAVPALAEWTDPDRAQPVTDVLPGGPLRNAYRGQGALDGRPCVPGLVSVGDSVATTTPIFGRGVTTTFLQVVRLLALLDSEPDPGSVGEPFDAWCAEQMQPWVADHVGMDRDAVRRWEGGDVDLSRRLPSDLILAAAAQDPRIGPATGGYLSMLDLPASLDRVEPLAHTVYGSGWRPAYTPGPSRRELRELVAAALG
ncbi:MAG TPA: FAD-dependent oxidoreductase [Blastococcus sp.]|nr:FAD-dependent oxidoreductase [Blastococcus sp.]